MSIATFEHTDFFPDEAFDDELDEHELDAADSAGRERLSHGYGNFISRIRTDARRIIDELESPGSKYLSIETEGALADFIQAGIAAAEQREKMGEDYSRELDHVISDGDYAKQLLCGANLPFAAYFARASIGLVKTAPVRVPSTTGSYYGFEAAPGTMKKASRLASPDASLEDRTQVAIEAMLKAADGYKANMGASFTSYAAHGLLNALQRHAPSEITGWGLAHHIAEQYRQALRNERVFGAYVSPVHRGDDGVKLKGLPPEQVFAGTQSVPLDSITRPARDEEDVFGAPVEVGIDEIVPKPELPIPDQVFSTFRQEEIAAVLDTLTEREAGIISLRFGLVDGVARDLAEVGKIYGLSAERIRQIQSRAIAKLQSDSRQGRLERLRDHYPDGSNENTGPLYQIADGAAHILTERSIANPRKSISARPPRDPNLESWQAYKDEPWELSRQLSDAPV